MNSLLKCKPGYPFWVFLLIFFILAFASLDHFGLTYDELSHFAYGEKILAMQSDRINDDDSKMPVSALNAMPRAVSKAMPDGKMKDQIRKVWCARMPTILLSAVAFFIVFLWTEKLYGISAAYLSTFLFVFEPNLLAHARLITTDLYATIAALSALYTFWFFLKKPGLRRLIPMAITFGIAQVSKYSCIFLVPIYLLILIIRYAFQKTRKTPLRSLQAFCRYTVVFSAIVILVINISYWFNGTAVLLKNYPFESQSMQNLQRRFAMLGNLPLPLPFPYVQGLDRVKYRDESGYRVNPVYFYGKLREMKPDFKGFKLYYFATLFLKVPLALQAIFFFSLFTFWRKRKRFHFLEDEIFLLLPSLFYFIQLSFFLRVQIGIRHALIFFPLLLIFCGSCLKGQDWAKCSPKTKTLLAGLCLFLVISNLSYFPHYISYFNELIYDRKMAYRIVADSNLDWGGNYWYLKRYRLQHPDMIYEPEEPMAGKIAVPINSLLGIFGGAQDRYGWLREHYRPVDQIAYSYLVFDVSEESLGALMR